MSKQMERDPQYSIENNIFHLDGNAYPINFSTAVKRSGKLEGTEFYHAGDKSLIKIDSNAMIPLESLNHCIVASPQGRQVFFKDMWIKYRKSSLLPDWFLKLFEKGSL